ncbi:M48 family metallopeptidase [Sediminibacterium sp.]|uniref:M48 family metallopeptidase n=1 Tax=Sediminibacterium sp. TaxID=1917865 RepID=UPI0025D9FA57|nr:M48 family metallopeptidase [Sediminibacterium sp.]MBW0177406.1 M48 family metallopeptidase [Sediminibacterium sp.]
MKKNIICLLLLSTVFAACHRNSITGRNQLSLLPDSEVQAMAFNEYKEFISTNPVVKPAGNNDAAMVQRAGERIIASIKKYYTEKGYSKDIENFAWEVNLVNNKEPNAWCMPGGKIVVYTGLLPLTQNEAALAVVMGHEVAHALARHGNERMSQGLLQQLGGVALSVAIADKPKETQNLFMTSYGIGSNVGVILPFSRKNELEADKLGLMFSSLAGYDPREAIPFWQRMAKAGGGNKPPEFLSTHPADATRITELQKVMEVMVREYYKK